jgi:hypothetical protein
VFRKNEGRFFYSTSQITTVSILLHPLVLSSIVKLTIGFDADKEDRMGQSASKAASRVGAAAAKKPHIPSMPGKGGPDTLSGFSHDAGAKSQKEEVQRQFLQTQQGVNADFKDKLPDDLIKFMTDVGPLKRKEEITTQRRRLPRTTSSLMDSSDHVVSQSPAADKTRRTENMRLAENIAGFETSRTTSFSHRQDVVDPDDGGLDVVQFYGLLTGQSSIESFCKPNIDEHERKQQLQLLEQSLQYLQLPVLLRDSDDTYVGAWPEKATDLQQEHRGMVELPKTCAKLVLDDLWDAGQGKRK